MSATRSDTGKTANTGSENRFPARPLTEDNSSLSKELYVLCDGAIKKPGISHGSTLLKTKKASNNVADMQAAPVKSATSRKRANKQISRTDHTPLDLITSSKSLIWLQKLDTTRLAIQWHVPNNIQRNCQDLLLNSDTAEFVLRLYQNVAVGDAKWKTSQRTHEYTIDIKRRRCFVNIDHSDGGIFTAEIGIRSQSGRYIFIARSGKCATPLFNPDPANDKVSYRQTQSRKQTLHTPKVFKNQGKNSNSNISNNELRERDIIAEKLVSGVYQDFLREGPRALRRINEKIEISSVAARADYLNELKLTAARLQQSTEKNKTSALRAIHSRRLDQSKNIEERYQSSPVENFPEKPVGYIPQALGRKDIEGCGVMVASMLNTAGTVAIDVFKKGENPSPNGKGRKVVKVKSKPELAKALKKSGIHEKSELILKGKLEPGRRVRVGGLLIDTEADGSFYVSCSIKNGKLHVPVEEVEAIIVE